ncbi:hypothetical protein SprV_0301072400 [Sparganum proliferum]
MTRFGHAFKFDEAEILARGDNCVSRELLESWFSGPQCINKSNDLSLPYSVLRPGLDGFTSHAVSAQVNTLPNARVGPGDRDNRAATKKPNEVVVSFSVKSLFTFILQDLTIETVELLLQSKYDETENRFGQTQVLQFPKFCLGTYFTFDGTTYEKVMETPMGLPISELMIEAVLQHLESLVFQHHRPKFWARDVGDIFVVSEWYQVLTFKEETENNQLAFLDVLVCRND